ncbi:hypothetical protein ACP275_14G067100 [Erythranthe tilingii]
MFVQTPMHFMQGSTTPATSISKAKDPVVAAWIDIDASAKSEPISTVEISSSCPVNYTLTHSGWLNVTHTDGPTFCEDGGCAEHTRAVLLCLYHVKIDYYFANFATIKDLSDTINNGCTSPQGFTGVSKYSSDGFRLNSTPIFTALSATALLFISIF